MSKIKIFGSCLKLPLTLFLFFGHGIMVILAWKKSKNATISKLRSGEVDRWRGM